MRPLIDFAGFDALSNTVEVLDQETDFVPRDRLRCNDLLELHDVWAALPRSGKGLPEYQDFDIDSFPTARPKICRMVVKNWKADDFEYVEYGAHPANYLNRGKDLNLAELRHDLERRENYLDIKNRVGRCIEEAKPSYVHKRLSWGARGFVSYEVIFLPFRSDGIEHVILTPVSAYDSGAALGEIPI